MGARSMSTTRQCQMCKLILSTVNTASTADMFAWLCNGRNCHYQKSTLGRTKWCTATACAKISLSTVNAHLCQPVPGLAILAPLKSGRTPGGRPVTHRRHARNAVCLHMTICGAGVSQKSFSSSGWKLSQLADLLRRSDSS